MPWVWKEKINNYISRKYFDKERAESNQSAMFDAINLSREIGLKHKLDLALSFGDIDDSEHTTLFASLSKNNRFKRILEIGTYNGNNARFLSHLFPKAKIETIDLSDENPIFLSSYGRENRDYRLAFLDQRKKNLKHNNINFKKIDSVCLLNYISNTYDLIWVDGAHGYPVVAIDIANALRLIKQNGIVVCDDVWVGRSDRESDSMYKSSASYNTLVALESAGIAKINFIYKRPDYSSAGRKSLKEYIAIVTRTKKHIRLAK
jgi:predicted O-methyltransferase YrrM